VDANNRVWFSTPGNVGYYTDNTNPVNLILFEPVTPTPSLIPVMIINVTPDNHTITNKNPSANTSVNTSSGSSSVMTIFSQITDPIARAISAIAQKFGVNIFS
jgi:hypothetical protein